MADISLKPEISRCMSNCCKHCILSLLFFLVGNHFIATWVQGSLIVQQSNCGSLRYPTEYMMQDRNEEVVYSHTPSRQYRGYAPNEECITSIIGKEGFQFTVRVTLLEVDKLADINSTTGEPIKCHDFLKIYDSPRADNARLLTPRTGLCGKQSRTTTFTTCTSFVTFEFWTDWEYDDMNGFNIEIEQFPWRIKGSTYTGESLTPGLTWSCFMKEFQDTWDKKAQVSGSKISQSSKSLGPYQKDLSKGVKCYSCPSCPVDYFNGKSYLKEEHCYLCGKIHGIKRADAKRVCYSQSDHMALLRTFRDGSEKTGGYLGCQVYSDEYMNTVRYCFCNTDLCNHSMPAQRPLVVMVVMVVVALVSHSCLLV